MIAAIVTAVLLVAGATFSALAGIGMVRMPDLYIRMHAATKAGTLGPILVLLAVAVHFADAGIGLRVAAAAGFLVLTAPVAAHIIGRAAHRTGVPLWERSVVDEWDRQPDSGSPQTTPTGETQS
jgi:multicomponent Na+:H+ antiporter subunit G